MPDWLSYLAVPVLLLIIPVIRSFLKGREKYRSHKIAYFFFYLGMVLFILFFASLIYPISQYQIHYGVKIDIPDKKLTISAASVGDDHKTYVDSMENYFAFYIEADSKSQKQSHENRRLKVSMLRKDGLNLYLGSYPRSTYERIKKLPVFENLRELSDPLSWYQALETDTAFVSNGNNVPFENVFQKNLSRNSDRGLTLNWRMTVSVMLIKFFVGLLGAAWAFMIFRLAAGNLETRAKMLGVFVLLVLSSAFSFYILNTHGARYQLHTGPDDYSGFTDSRFLGATGKNSGKYGDIAYMSVSTNPSDLSGILISEISQSKSNAFSQFQSLLEGALQNKMKHIRVENLTVVERIVLFDFLQAKRNGSGFTHR